MDIYIYIHTHTHTHTNIVYIHTECPKSLEPMVNTLQMLIAWTICAPRVHPNPHALSKSVYHVTLNSFQHIGISSSASLGNSLPKIFAIRSILFWTFCIYIFQFRSVNIMKFNEFLKLLKI
jgi:hypothetical protein